MADIVQSLFGITPEMYQQSQQARADAQALQYAKLSPFEQANFNISRGANMLAGAVGRGLGGEDPELARITARQQISRQINYNDPTSIARGVEMLAAANDTQGAMMLADVGRKASSEQALAAQRRAQAERETKQAIPTDIQISDQIANLKVGLTRLEALPESPETNETKNLLTYRLSELERLTNKDKPEARIPYGPEAERAAVAEFGKPFSELTQAQAKVIDTLLESRGLTKAERGASKVSATATSKGSDEGAKTIAELDAKRLGAAQVSAGKAVEQAGLLQELLKTPQPISGSGAPARVGALRVFSTFGLTSSKDDEALGNADKFNALAGERVISFIKALGSNPTDTDREFARTIGPALEKGTKTNTDLINFLLERSRKVVKDADAMEAHFYDKNYSLRGFKSPFLSDLETPKSKASDLTTEQLKRIARGEKP